MTDVPVLTPVNNPVPAPIVATPVEPELQAPPVVVEASVAVPPIHKLRLPVITAGIVPTVTVTTLRQLDDNA
jgi:hypothetical protein